MKNLSIVYILSLILMSLSVLGQQNNSPVSGSGKLKTEKRNISDFSHLKINQVVTVYLKQGKSEEASIETDDNIVEYVTTQVNNDTLTIDLKGAKINNIKPIKVYLTIPEIKSIIASNGADVNIQGTLFGGQLSCVLSSGSNLIADLSLIKLNLDLRGGAGADLSGRTKEVDVKVEGGSYFNGKDLITIHSVAEVSNGSEASLRAEGKSTVTASGSSEVTFYGKQQILNQSASDVSQIKIKKARKRRG